MGRGDVAGLYRETGTGSYQARPLKVWAAERPTVCVWRAYRPDVANGEGEDV